MNGEEEAGDGDGEAEGEGEGWGCEGAVEKGRMWEKMRAESLRAMWRYILKANICFHISTLMVRNFSLCGASFIAQKIFVYALS